MSNLGKMESEFKRIDVWLEDEARGWQGPEVASRFEAGAEGKIWTELVKAGPRLAEYPAAVEVMNALSLTGITNPTILDFGCANGVYGDIFARNEKTRESIYIGADINPIMIESCRKRYPDRRFFVIECNNPFDLDDNSVDVVFASGVMENIKDTDWVMSEFRRVSRSAAILFRVPVRPLKPSAVYWQVVKHHWGTERHSFHLFNEEELHRRINDAGFNIAQREVSAASGEWTPPDDSEPVKHYTYVLN